MSFLQLSALIINLTSFPLSVFVAPISPKIYIGLYLPVSVLAPSEYIVIKLGCVPASIFGYENDIFSLKFFQEIASLESSENGSTYESWFSAFVKNFGKRPFHNVDILIIIDISYNHEFGVVSAKFSVILFLNSFSV